MRAWFAVTLSVAAASLAVPADAKCAFVGVAPAVLAGAAEVEIQKDGGIVVAAVANHEAGRLDKGDEAMQPAWKLRVRRALVPPKIESLAPGLAVYLAPKDAASFELEDDQHKVVGKARVAAAAGPVLAAPKVKAARIDGRRGGRDTWEHLDVEIDGAVPDGAIAIIAADADGKPRSWGRVAKGKTIRAFQSERCQALPNGTRETKPGDKITLAWVDASGRKSALSAPVVVGGAYKSSKD